MPLDAQFEVVVPAVEARSDGSLHLGWRVLITLILLLLVMLLGLLLQYPIAARAAGLDSPAAQNSGDRLVLAFYYTWFDEATWTYDKLSDLPAEPYVSRDRGVMGRHIDQARGAGIDAFVVAWYGPTGESNQTEPNLAALLDEAAARGFKIAALFETDSPFLGSTTAATSALQHLLNVHANHPAYLRVDGRPVVFFWRPNMYSVDAWATIRNQVDPNRGSFWVGEGVDTALLAVFDGHHLYSNTWNPPSDLLTTNRKFAARVDAMGADRLWVATVMPGYNDVKIRAGVGFAKDREGGAYYERAWQAAIDGSADWVVINSFNEWPEGTYIEPSAAFGDQYLGLTAAWSSRFKGAAPPAPSTAGAPLPTAEAPAPDSPTAYVRTALLNLRAGPGVSYALLGRVAEGEALPIVGALADGTWWRVQAGGGEAWVFGDLVQIAGPIEQVPREEAPVVAPAAVPPPAVDAPTDTALDTAVDADPGFILTINGQTFTVRQARTPAP